MKKLTIPAVAGLLAVALVGCSTPAAQPSATSSSASSAPTTASSSPTEDINAKIQAGLDAMKGKVLASGPHGEAAEPPTTVALTDDEIAKIKSMNLTAAIALHYGGNDWANAQVAGLKAEFARLGITIVATTDANFNPGQQVSDIETIMAKKPSILVSIPTDPVATADAYMKASAAGAKIVFMDNCPNGMTAGKDYVTVVSADNYGNGVVSAYLMAKALGGKGTIATIFHNADFFVTAQRYDGFKKTIQEQFPDIKIVAEQGIAGPDFAGDAQKVTDALLTQNPNLDGIWAVWDVPAEGVMASARSADKMNLKIATQDLGTNVAIALAKNELVVGLGAQLPYDQGVTEADAAAASILGKTVPAYIAVPALAVSHDNVLDAWKTVYHADPPAALAAAYKK